MAVYRNLFWVVICCATFSAGAQNIDIDMLKGINSSNTSSPVWRGASNSVNLTAGVVTFGTLIYGFASKDKNVQHNGYELLITSVINIGATEVLKRTFNRTRPADKYPGVIFVSSSSKGKSFPSGHTSEAFAVATTLTLQYKKWYVVAPAYLWAGCVGYSRMYLGKHYPSDVLGGALVGAGSSWLSHVISDKLFRRTKNKQSK